MNRISTIQGHGQPGCRWADRGGAAAHSMAALLKRVFIFIALMLTTASGAWADDVLYAEVSGTAMTLKYGAKPDGAYEFNGTQDWATFRGNITTATVEASCKAYDGWTLSNLFYGFAKLTTINDLTNLNTEQVNDMNLMFSYCIALTSLNLSAFNTAKVTNMYSMFEGCSALTAITVGNGWSTSKVTESSSMFKDCTSLPGYDASKTDKTNAHTGEGGYLTAAAPAGPTTYSVTLADGTEDAANWQAQVGDGEFTVLPVTGLEGGETVTIQYNGTRRIKSITAVQTAAAAGWDGDLAKLTGEEPEGYATATDGMTITGTLADGVNVKVSIAAGAKVTLDGATINGVSEYDETDEPLYKWAGLTCAGDATITLKGVNSVKGFYMNYPGIIVPSGKTLTIKGDGSLTASSNGSAASIGGGSSGDIECGNITIEGGTIVATGGLDAAGIGGGQNGPCGDITITGGTVTATGGSKAAGIGGSYYGSCGNITITGGTVIATGNREAAGIGSGYSGSCGNITITDGVTKVVAIKGTGGVYDSDGKNSIGYGNYSYQCGTVTIGGTEYFGTNPQNQDEKIYKNGGDNYLTKKTIIYPAPDLQTVTVGSATLKYASGDTWRQAVEYYAEDNAGWSMYGDHIIYKSGDNYFKVTDGANEIAPTSLVSGTATYELQDALFSITIGGETTATFYYHPHDTWLTAAGNGHNSGWTADEDNGVKYGNYTLLDPLYGENPSNKIDPNGNYKLGIVQ